ncbi:sulfotransferase domain-containing protein [Planktotalea sp.]|uniref:sulfotransferase domain-containing protein n=1 Tax=Planktotalea sp. TaxID=2029877 RepID=UPI003297E4D1
MTTIQAKSKCTYWIASYPKSGNTWLRMLLATYFSGLDVPLNINALPSGTLAYHRKRFDELLGLETADFPTETLTDLRPRIYDMMAGSQDFQFVKTHECFTRTSSGEAVFSEATSAGAILIVRNPLDVAVSMSHFLRMSIDDTITRMSRNSQSSQRIQTELIPHETGSWSSFAQSWFEGSMPLLVVRYEDLLDQPEMAFSKVLSFMNEPINEARLQKTIAFNAFENLRAQELKDGFAAMQTGAASFFRKGQNNNWKQQLTSEQQERLHSDHVSMMKQLGYEPQIV